MAPLKKLGLPVEETTLDFADLFFEGRGSAGATVSIGIEYKHLGELITSIRDGRFAGHQLPGMQRYDYRYLLYDGDWKEDESTGLIVAYDYARRIWKPIPGKMMASEFRKHLLTYQHVGGIYVEHARARATAYVAIRDLYYWWNDRALDEHTSLSQIHTPSSFGPLSPFRKAVCAWPEIGVKLSRVVEERFRSSIQAAANASVGDWAELRTATASGSYRRFGQPTAERLVKFLRGEE